MTMQQTPLLMSRIVGRGAQLDPHEEVVTLLENGTHRQTLKTTWERANQLAAALKAHGINVGDRVASFMWNNYRHLELYQAVPSMGAVLHTLNIRLSPNDLEYIIHPKVSEAINKEVQESYDPYVIIIVPLLIETGYNKFVNRILVVDCALDTQIKRLIKRDHETFESAKRIIGHQIEQQNRLKMAHDVIDNDINTTIEDLGNRVEELHQSYLELSGK